MSARPITLVETTEDVLAFKRWLSEPRAALAVDTETEGLDWVRHKVRLVQLGDTREAWCIPAQWWLGAVREALAEYRGPLVMHNAKYDSHILKSAGIDVPAAQVHDTMIMSHIIDPTGSHALKSLASRILGENSDAPQAELRDVMDKNKWTWATVPIDLPQYWVYAGVDTILTAQLFEKLAPMMQPYSRVYDLERAVQQVLLKMERNGIRYDPAYCRRTAAEWRARVEQLTRWCADEYGVTNPNANPQVYKRLEADGVSLIERTPTGKPKLTEDVLLQLTHPLAKVVLEIRHKTKMCSAYLESFVELAHNGFIHPSIHQVGARTGRMSVTRPGLQTLPRGPDIRDAFIPREGNSLLLADYAGIEMRGMAHFSQDAAMVAAYLRGEDLHDYAASRLYGPGFTREQRTTAKHTGFAKIYGAGINKLAMTSGITVDEAGRVVAAYDMEFPGVREFQQRVVDVVSSRASDNSGVGWVTTPVGRRHPVERQVAYKAVNYLIQGWAADVLKEALVRLDIEGLGDMMVLPVHDEVVFDVPTDQVEDVRKTVHEVMEVHGVYAVPITVESKVVQRWGTAYR